MGDKLLQTYLIFVLQFHIKFIKNKHFFTEVYTRFRLNYCFTADYAESCEPYAYHIFRFYCNIYN